MPAQINWSDTPGVSFQGHGTPMTLLTWPLAEDDNRKAPSRKTIILGLYLTMSNILGKLISQASGQKQSGGQSSKQTLVDKAAGALIGTKYSQDNQNQIGGALKDYKKANNGPGAYNDGHGSYKVGGGSEGNDGHGGYNNGHGGYNNNGPGGYNNGPGGYNDGHGGYNNNGHGGYNNNGHGGYNNGHGSYNVGRSGFGGSH
ncbi:hypothetical protein Purlil1_13997 [Purpureocillium lilacinum]|uniref:Uncharacterized protein n=1 Tax=Purpureocillium lilacinum TaxID=33203 RepID=A0ABR0BCJ7_PURLI|nr:hypothetical protein Purlil1_13997 [Purpureocillium lilacinum]